MVARLRLRWGLPSRLSLLRPARPRRRRLLQLRRRRPRPLRRHPRPSPPLSPARPRPLSRPASRPPSRPLSPLANPRPSQPRLRPANLRLNRLRLQPTSRPPSRPLSPLANLRLLRLPLPSPPTRQLNPPPSPPRPLPPPARYLPRLVAASPVRYLALSPRCPASLSCSPPPRLPMPPLQWLVTAPPPRRAAA